MNTRPLVRAKVVGKTRSPPNPASLSSNVNASTVRSRFWQPAESAVHAGTLMCWPTITSVYRLDIDETRSEVANIVRAIAKHERVHLLVCDNETRGDDLSTAFEAVDGAKNVIIHRTPDVNSLWARDTGPIFVYSNNDPSENTLSADRINPDDRLLKNNAPCETIALGLHFNQWGGKFPPSRDSCTAGAAAKALGFLSYFSPFVGEGGALEVDGQGTLMATESSLLNPNRNPGVSKEQMEAHLYHMFGITKTVWLPGLTSTDVTDTHIDVLARFGGQPGTVLLSRPWAYDSGHADSEAVFIYQSAREVLEKEVDAQGRRLSIVDIQEPHRSVLGEDYEPVPGFRCALGYVNFYLANGAVILSSFGDKSLDEKAKRQMQEQFPDRVVEQVPVRQLAMQCGGIHCATQQIVPEG